LNDQLAEERGKYRTLETSFNRLEASHLKDLKDKEAEKKKVQDKLDTQELKTKTAEAQRNILAGIVLVGGIFGAIMIFLKMRR
jgi:hypothetical protein